jgi:lactate dehydrogenase-like 2-hydroxyacid dehydrogenase
MSKSLPIVLVTHTLPENWLEMLVDRCNLVIGPPDATVIAPLLLSHLSEAEGVFCLLTIPIDASLLEAMPRLRVISNMAVGYDNIDIAACTRRGIPVGNTPGVLTEGTADLTMGLLLAAARKLLEASLDAREGRWRTWSPTGWLGADLDGATLGIVGMGKIGCAVAKRAHGFGLSLLYTDTAPNAMVEEAFGASYVTLPELLSRSDFISLHVPLTPDTRHLINTNTLKLIKPRAILINASRGPVVETMALYEALRDGLLAGAALDVTEPEPLPPDHPLYGLPNCLIVPHIGSATWNTRRRMAELACENLILGLEGKPLRYCVNPTVYSTNR